MSRRLRLDNKVAIVTGAGTGIGRGIALAFAREGARVALIGRREAPLNEVAGKIGPDRSLVIPGDVTDPDFVARVVDETSDWFGELNVLVNNAGTMFFGTVETSTEEQWEEMFNVNVRAVWLLSRAVLPHLRTAGGGSIVNISSIVGLVGAKNRAGYAASKGAVTQLTKCMALDHAHEKIRVNCLCPAFLETEMTMRCVNGMEENTEEYLAMRRTQIPVGRFGEPEDIATAAVFLASDESSWVTGTAIPIDGGYTAQ